MLKYSAHPQLLSRGRYSLTLRRRLALLSVPQPSRSYIVAAASTRATAAVVPLPSQASATPTKEPQTAPTKAVLRIQEAAQAIGGVLLVDLNRLMPCMMSATLYGCMCVTSCSKKELQQNNVNSPYSCVSWSTTSCNASAISSVPAMFIPIYQIRVIIISNTLVQACLEWS